MLRLLTDLLPQLPWKGPPIPRGLTKNKAKNPHGGITYVDFKVKSLDKTKSAELKGMVDTGSTISRIPKSVADELGLKIALRGIPSRQAVGPMVYTDAVWGYIQIGDKEMLGYISTVEDGRPAVGAATLEIMGYKVNPITGKLEETEIFI